MPLVKSTLSQQLEAVFKAKPEAAQAASDWANAYLAYASTAMSAGSSLPVTASANLGLLVSAFTGAFQTQSASGAAGQIALGVTGFWGAMVWAGAGVGTTISPGNSSLSSDLSAIFDDTSESSDADKAGKIADAFDAGAKLVMVSDILPGVPPITVVGPIS